LAEETQLKILRRDLAHSCISWETSSQNRESNKRIQLTLILKRRSDQEDNYSKEEKEN
jgi:hypothetical protein